MKRQNNIIYVNAMTLRNLANFKFGGNRGLAKSWLKKRYSGRTIMFSETWGAV